MKARENPFASRCIESLPFRFPAGWDWERLLARLGELNYCASIVGPHGSGKTTLLEQLAPRLEALDFKPRFFQLKAESGMREKERLVHSLREVKKPEIIMLDGAEQLTTRQWLPVRSSAGQAAGLIVTVHRTSRLQVLLECETNVRLLEELVLELTGGALPHAEADSLYARHHGDLRAAMRELYDRWDGLSHEPGS